MRVLHEFLLFKVKETQGDEKAQPTSVSMYYLAGAAMDLNLQAQNTTLTESLTK